MSKKLIYSVLQYKHSALLNEAINVGVLFYFPEDTKKLYFRYATPDRIRAIYTGFDLSYYNALFKLIKNSVEKSIIDHQELTYRYASISPFHFQKINTCWHRN